MVELGFFLSEVLVVFLMLVGMIIGDVAACLRFGRIKRRIRQLAYLFLFVIFLVIGNYVPSFFNLSLSLYEAIILFSFWGFASVFTSRFLLFAYDFFLRRLRVFLRSNEGLTMVKKKRLSRSLSMLSLDLRNDVFEKAIKKENDGFVYVDARDFEDALCVLNVNTSDRINVLIFGLNFSPEKATCLVYD